MNLLNFFLSFYSGGFDKKDGYYSLPWSRKGGGLQFLAFQTICNHLAMSNLMSNIYIFFGLRVAPVGIYEIH